jgi:hypothetical protein
MRRALTEFLQDVRAEGVAFSVAESIDALRAAAAVGVEREALREALAAAVVKEEVDREAFDRVFDRFFRPADVAERKRRGRKPSSEPGAAGRSERESGGAGRRKRDEPEPARKPRPAPERSEPKRDARKGDEHTGSELRRRRRQRELLRRPFREMTPPEAEELRDLAAELARRFHARLRRRLRASRRGRLDFRRTLRRSISHGGVAIDPAFRRRRPGRPDLVALCDLSGSVKHATEFFASILAPAAGLFRRVRLFVYIDRVVEASIENGRLVPDEPIDFHAFSDLGRALADAEPTLAAALTRSTVLLVLGDARNNRRPARSDVLGRLASRSRACWWLNPERRERWGGGDSAIESYRPHVDELLECGDAGALLAALARVTTGT